MHEFRMPSLGADMESGTLIEWLKAPGDAVARGDIVAVVHTDKADVEVEVFAAGVLGRQLVDVGSEVPVGTPLALILEPGDSQEAMTAEPAAPEPPPPARPVGDQETQARAVALVPGRVLISPSARQLAAELGVDVASVQGSGPGGRIQRRDVERAAESSAGEPPAPVSRTPDPGAPGQPAAPTRAALPADDRSAAMRRAISTAMTRSKREIPHFYLAHSIDLSRTVAWLTQENLHRSVPERILLAIPLLKASALALREVPELNQTWKGEDLVRHDEINVGVAISLRGGGLVAPAILRTDELSIDELMRAFRDLVARARSGSLRSSEMARPTITVTSLGERGVETVFGIVFPPQVAIVGFGAVVERLWLFEGQPLPCPVVQASLSADHRVVDGHRAGAFLLAVDRILQQPESL